MAPGQKRRLRKVVLERDGSHCFYCHKPMPEGDMTLEHLVAVKHGGKNSSANLVLAHALCNERMGSRPVIEKIRYRESRRQQWTAVIVEAPPAELRVTRRDMVWEELYHRSLAEPIDPWSRLRKNLTRLFFLVHDAMQLRRECAR
jgi:hypothetical protein